MQTSINSRGFTLIELLVVVLLLGLGLGVGLTVDFGGSPQQQKQQALLLANALELAAQEAVLDSAVLGLDFFTSATDQASAYRWLELHDAAWRPYALDDTDNAETLVPTDLTVALSIADQPIALEARVDLPTATAFAPEILLLPTRELTPFTLTVSGAAGAPSVLSADLMGRIRVDADAPPPP